MRTTEQIERSNVGSEQSQADPLHERSSVAARQVVELRSDPREPPPITRSLTKPSPSFMPATRNQRVRWALFALLPVVLIAGGFWYVSGSQVMSTDDAYVEADKVGISTEVSGILPDKCFTGSILVSFKSRWTTPRPIWRRPSSRSIP